jgi:hypothetical protein
MAGVWTVCARRDQRRSIGRQLSVAAIGEDQAALRWEPVIFPKKPPSPEWLTELAAIDIPVRALLCERHPHHELGFDGLKWTDACG